MFLISKPSSHVYWQIMLHLSYGNRILVVLLLRVVSVVVHFLRTIHLNLWFFLSFYLFIQITNKILCDYFRQFGAIERVQIVPERLKFFDILPAVGTAGTGFVDQPPSQRKYYAYVTFVNTLGASEALSKQRHLVQEREIEVEQAFSWNQPAADLEKHFMENQQPTSTAKETLYRTIDEGLNDDCIYKIMTYLNIFDLAAMAKYNSRFQAVAEQIHCLTISRSANENPVTLMELRNILRLLGFGHSVTNLTVSIKSFHLSAQRHICDRLFQYIGPQLRSLTLSSFGVTTEQFELMKPLLFHLNFLDIDFNYNFDYRRFNCAWPNLKTLRMRTSGFVDTFISEDEPAPEFPALTKLMIASGYRLHKNLFQRLHRACSKITELVVINIDDYYSELPTLVLRTTDLANLSEFTELTRLHLSFSRSYFNATIIDVISKLTKLEHLTLEITNVRQSDDRIFIPLNRSLRQIGSCLPNIAEVRFSGIPLEEDKLVELIRFATKLNNICIYECNIELNAQLIRNIVTSRKELFSTTIGQRTPIPLNIIVNEFSDPVIMNVSIPLQLHPNSLLANS